MNKWLKQIVVLIFFAPVCIIFFAIILSSQENKVRFNYNNDYIELDSFIYDKIYYRDMNDIKFLNDVDLHIQKRGIGFLNSLFFSGEVFIDYIGDCRAYIHLQNKDYIIIDSKNVIILNFETEEKTKEIYNKLKITHDNVMNCE